MPWSLAHVIFSLLHACCQHLHISQLLQLCLCSAVWKGESHVPAQPQSCALPSARHSSLSSASEAASKQLSSCLGGSMAQLGSTAVREHTWTTPGQALHGHSSDKKAEWNPEVFGGTDIRCHVNREIYTRVFLYTGVATQV